MRDSKPQRCVQQNKSLKVTPNATNRDKYINEASKQIFAKSLIKISCNYTQDMPSILKICFYVFNIRTFDEFLCNLSKFNEIEKVTTSTH